MSWQGTLGARRFLRHIHNLGDRGSARLGTRPARAVSGPDAGNLQPRHNLRRSVGFISAANFPCAVDVDADVGSYAYDARYAAARDVARNDQTHDCRDLGSREPPQFCLAEEFRDPRTACGPWTCTEHPRTHIMDREHTDEEHTMDIESSQEVTLDNWGKQLLENILLTAAEAVGERREISDSIEVTLTFRLTPIVSKDHLELSVAFKRDPTLRTYIPRQF